MKKVIISLKGFTKVYGKKVVIDNVDLDVYENEFLTLLGSSGCGKTTMLRSISGLDKPTNGRVYIDGEDVTDFDPIKRKVNTIFQNYALFPLMTVYDNIAFGLKMQKIPKEEIQKRVQDMLELVHLDGYENRYPKELSGGEQQRVSLARGLINKPKVLLLDEPLSALDLKLRKEMQIELKQLQKKLKITFIYVTHSQDEALSMSDRIAIIKNGKIEQLGTPQEIYDMPKTLYAATFIGDTNVIKGKVTNIDNKKGLVYINNNIVGNINGNINGNNFNIGDDVNVAIRPENIKIAISKKKNNYLEGIIEELIYDGVSNKLMVDTGDFVIKALVYGNDFKYEVYEKVKLYWDILDVVVFGDGNEK